MNSLTHVCHMTVSNLLRYATLYVVNHDRSYKHLALLVWWEVLHLTMQLQPPVLVCWISGHELSVHAQPLRACSINVLSTVHVA